MFYGYCSGRRKVCLYVKMRFRSKNVFRYMDMNYLLIFANVIKRISERENEFMTKFYTTLKVK